MKPPLPQIVAPVEPPVVVDGTLVTDEEAASLPVALSKPPSFGRQVSVRVVQAARQASASGSSSRSAHPADLSALPPLAALRDCFHQELGVEGATLVEVVDNAYTVCGLDKGGGGRVGLLEKALAVWLALGSPPMSRYHEEADEPAAYAAAQHQQHQQPASNQRV